MDKIRCAVCQTTSLKLEFKADKRLGENYYECENCNKLRHFEKELLKVLLSIDDKLQDIVYK